MILYPTVGKMVEIFDKNCFDYLTIGDPQTGMGAIKITEYLAIFFHQIPVMEMLWKYMGRENVPVNELYPC